MKFSCDKCEYDFTGLVDPDLAENIISIIFLKNHSDCLCLHCNYTSDDEDDIYN